MHPSLSNTTDASSDISTKIPLQNATTLKSTDDPQPRHKSQIPSYVENIIGSDYTKENPENLKI